MLLINCKVELKFSVLSAGGAVNTNANHSNIIVTIKETKLHVTPVTLSARDNQKTIKTSSEMIWKIGLLEWI